ncbi:MAG TPA: DUF3291 domain-containing protein [Actinomycetota bacterium]|nr:DUF3291 domain-containing protein [Actinomycetota bacterium]
MDAEAGAPDAESTGRPEARPEIPTNQRGYWLAQLNVARLKAPLESPAMAGFVALLDPINALADAQPGFVWRHQGEHGHEVGLLGEPDLLVNLSVWASLEALREFTYGDAAPSAHGVAVGRRREWFSKMDGPHQALWWVERGHLPTLDEAGERLRHLRHHRSSGYAFTFRSPHPAPEPAERA